MQCLSVPVLQCCGLCRRVPVPAQPGEGWERPAEHTALNGLGRDLAKLVVPKVLQVALKAAAAAFNVAIKTNPETGK